MKKMVNKYYEKKKTLDDEFLKIRELQHFSFF